MRAGRCGLLMVLCLCAAGCGHRAPQAADPTLARSSLETALESWRQGEQPGTLRERKPPIICGDSRWESGAKLLSYRILEGETSDGVNMHVTVELLFRAEDGESATETTTYVVGTDPAITIFPE